MQGRLEGGGGQKGQFPPGPHLKKYFFRHVINHILYTQYIKKKF